MQSCAQQGRGQKAYARPSSAQDCIRLTEFIFHLVQLRLPVQAICACISSRDRPAAGQRKVLGSWESIVKLPA
ncbi:hypothetical protein ANAPC5_01231 [Anaplasma phagocytophilum]|nr:hypothetical protein ANAPC5_01231 [Anaplasma phagocytophilum]